MARTNASDLDIAAVKHSTFRTKVILHINDEDRRLRLINLERLRPRIDQDLLISIKTFPESNTSEPSFDACRKQ